MSEVPVSEASVSGLPAADGPIQVERRGPAAWLRYAKAPRNAWDWDMLHAHNAILQDLIADPDVRVIVLSSGIAGYFSVGADLAVFDGLDPMGMADWVDLCHTGVRLLRGAPKRELLGGFTVLGFCGFSRF